MSGQAVFDPNAPDDIVALSGRGHIVLTIDVYDPWVPALLIEQAGCRPVVLETVLAESDFVFVLAGVTSLAFVRNPPA